MDHLSHASAAGHRPAGDPERLREEADDLRRQVTALAAANRQLSGRLEELRASHEDLLSSLQDGVIVLDGQGAVVSVNQAAEELTGLSETSVRGRRLTEVLPPSAPLAALVVRTLAVGRSHVDFDMTLTRMDGTRRTVSAVASQVSDAQGERRGQVLVLRDLSRVRDLEERVRRSDRLVALGVLAAGLAHEVRNPLVGVRAAAQLLEKEVGFPEGWREFTAVIIREVDRLNRLVDDLLAFAVARPLHRRPCNVNQLLDEALALAAAALQAGGVGTSRQYDPALPDVHADRDRLLQVFLNLIRNAAEAMAARGQALVVRTRFERVAPPCGGGPAVVVEVEDRGPGMSPEVEAKLFTPFFTTKPKGTGLGLPISLRIVEEHGGALEAHSRHGEGTTFRVLLPIRAEDGRG